MSIADRLLSLREKLTDPETLVAVSKTHPNEAIQEAYAAGQRHFGENYAQELRDKARALPDDIRWHYIGRLQRNKIKYIAPVAYRVHGLTHVDQAVALAKKSPTLLKGLIQVDIAQEVSKGGVHPRDVGTLADEMAAVDGFQLVGLMCIPPANDGRTREWFRATAELAQSLVSRGHDVHELSMGMSADWPLALEHGARWVRVGTSIFGRRTR